MGVFAKKPRKRDGLVVWYADFTDQRGRRVREAADADPKTGKFTRRQAERLLALRELEVRKGTYVNPRDVEPKAEVPTFAEFGERFLRDYPRRKKSEHYASRIGALGRFFGPMRMDTIHLDSIDRYVAQRRRLPDGAPAEPVMLERVGDSTLRKDLVVLKTMFKYAVRWGVVTANPTEHLDLPSEPDHAVDFLTEDQYRAGVAHMPDWLRHRAQLAVATGLRLKEVLVLEWGHIGDRIHLSANNKTGKTRTIPLSATARAALDEQRAEQEAAWREAMRAAGKVVPKPRYVFGEVRDEGDRCPYPDEANRTTKATIAAFAAAGIRCTFHGLRHTFASWAVQDGTDLYEVGKILGHSSPVLTQRYAKFAPNFGQKAASSIDRRLGFTDTRSAPVAVGASVGSSR